MLKENKLNTLKIDDKLADEPTCNYVFKKSQIPHVLQEIADLCEIFKNGNNKQILDGLDRFLHIAHGNIKINHFNLEIILEVGFRFRSSDLSNKAFMVAAYILQTRPTLGIEIVDSLQGLEVSKMIFGLMTQEEERVVNNFLCSSYHVMDILNDKLNYFNILLSKIKDPNTQYEHLIQLLSILSDFLCEAYDNLYEEKTFNEILPIFLKTDSPLVFSKIVYILLLILEDIQIPKIYSYLFDNNIDLYLLSKFPESKQLEKEHILKIFICITGGTDESANQIYSRNFLQNIQQYLSYMNEKCLNLLFQILTNLFSLGYDVILKILSLGFAEMSLNLLENGKYSTKETIILFLCGISIHINNDKIYQYFTKFSLMNEIIEFFYVSKKKIWDKIVHALYIVSENLNEECFLDSPLFNGIDGDELLCMLYQVLEKYENDDDKLTAQIEVKYLIKQIDVSE